MDRRLRTAGIAAAAALLGATAPGPTTGRFVLTPFEADLRRVSFDENWRFFRGAAPGAEQPAFDDTSWRRLDLPHDWAIEGPFDSRLDPHMGALPASGVGWYRKRFRVPDTSGMLYYSLELDGAMSNATVWLNGRELGSRPYGYIGFAFDLTPHLRPGGENLLAVRLSPEERSSRWYPGAGLYRHVWLDRTGPVHVDRWGTYVTTPRVSDAEAAVAVATRLRNRSRAPRRVTLETAVRDAEGRETARTAVERIVPAGRVVTVPVELSVRSPQRWGIDRPYLYSVVSTVRRGGLVLDRYVTPFGIRTVEFSREEGMLLNGRRVRLQGVCLHHDLAALGAAVNRRAIERRLEILKEMGANALRTSHNPPAPELLDAADQLGFLVMDEAFDMWRMTKVENGHGKYFDEWGEADLRDMLRRDRNHPSIVLWSIGNEVLEQEAPDGWKIAKRLGEICRREDPTRPVTAGFNRIRKAIENGLVEQVDIPGLNYGAHEYAEILDEHPDWILLGSETAATTSSRGVYHLPIESYEKHESLQLSSYDVVAPPWGYLPDLEFEALAASPAVLGEFVWAGFDYLGEPVPYFREEPQEEKDWPARSSYFGLVDLAGFPKDRYYLYQSHWTQSPMVHLLPHWSWPGFDGRPIPVMAYTNAEEVELFLNGRSLGRKKRGAEPVVLPAGEKASASGRFASRWRLLWQVPYEPGTLEAIAYTGGRTVATHRTRTAGRAARVALLPDRTTILADGQDLAFVTARIEDSEGTLVPDAEPTIRFEVKGAGRIAGVDNGNAASVESFQGPERKAFSGLALLIVRSNRGQSGPVTISATAGGLAPGSAVVVATPP